MDYGTAASVGGIIGNALKGEDDTWRKQFKKYKKWDEFKWRQDYKNQKEFAQNSIQWRAEDAKAAGIHPLAALGAGGALYSPAGGSQMPNPAPEDDSGDAILSAAMQLAKNLDGPSDLEAAQTDYWKAKAEEAQATSRTMARNLRNSSQTTNYGDADKDGNLAGGIKIKESKNWSDADLIEMRYGDVASWAYGLGVLIADAGETWRSYSKDQKLHFVKEIRRKAKETSENTRELRTPKISKLVEIPGDAP